MKIIEDNYSNSGTKKMTCQRCGSIFEYDKSDVMKDECGYLCIECPCCEETIYLETNKNISFPDSFWHPSEEASVSIPDSRINHWIQEGLTYLRDEDEADFVTTWSGDTIVIIVKYDGDQEYEIVVSKDFYTLSIPYEPIDFKNKQE